MESLRSKKIIIKQVETAIKYQDTETRRNNTVEENKVFALCDSC